MMAHACNSRTQEAEARGALSQKTIYSLYIYIYLCIYIYIFIVYTSLWWISSFSSNCGLVSSETYAETQSEKWPAQGHADELSPQTSGFDPKSWALSI